METPTKQPLFFRRHKWVLHLLFGLLIFSGGIVTGGGITLRLVWTHWNNSFTNSEANQERIAAHLAGALSLDEKQREAVTQCIKAHMAHINNLRGSIWPEVNKELDTLREEVSAQLDSRQKAHWQRLFDNLRHIILPVTSLPTADTAKP